MSLRCGTIGLAKVQINKLDILSRDKYTLHPALTMGSLHFTPQYIIFVTLYLTIIDFKHFVPLLKILVNLSGK